MDVEDIRSDLTEVLITEEEIHSKLAELARRVEADYPDEPPLLVGVLKGAVMVMADFARELRIHVEMDWMAVSSYGASTQSSGVVRILKDLDTEIAGRDVLIVEDIIDSGLTLSWLRANLESRGARSVKILTLLRKPEAAKVEVEVEYVGFEIPPAFVVGYGLDYAEKYRNLRAIGVLAPHVYQAE
ncbi:MAG: hypoxanthine phosphoribosyltransferase [Microcella sp.]|uniref:hypoxanthine phosphoribosyltransferase n=1 Tax=Microcella sp. TaxID=1913979 RepID=UPI003315D140